jgi:hypothetical protein
MADQTSVRGVGYPGKRPNPGGSQRDSGNGNGTIVGSIADFGNDVATLVELQARLASVDTRESVARATVPLAVAGAGAVVLLASVSVILFGLADLVASALAISPGLARSLTGLVSLTLAGAVLYLSAHELGKSLEPLRRSREELVRNLAWLRTVLVHSGRTFPKRGS